MSYRDEGVESSADEDVQWLATKWANLKSAWRFLLAAFLGAGLLAFLITTFAIRPTFTAMTQLMPPQQPQSNAAALLGSLAGVAGGSALGGLKNPADQWLGLLRSQSIADAIVGEFRLTEAYDVKTRASARKILAANSVILVSKEGLIRVEVDDHDPKQAAAIANAYVKQLQLLTRRLALTESKQRRVYFEGLMREAKDNLVTAEIALRSGNVNANLLRASPDKVSLNLAQLKAQISMQEVKVANVATYATADSPVMKMAQSELAELRRQLRELLQGLPEDANETGANYISRYRNFKYYEALFEIMAKQYEMARADEARQGVALQVVDVAEPPERKSKPNRGLVTLSAALAGLLLAAVRTLGISGRRREA
jgi:tyrosine-protein kinase Etk/Wzc